MLVAVAVLSAAALGYEILLTRLFSIVQWHHFAFLVISVALLGFGASGTFLLVLGDRIRTGIEPFLALAALGFGLAAPVCFVIAERVPFNVLDAPWSPGSLGWLLVIELLLAIPFFFAATGIGRALVVFRHRLARIYAADLAGAGIGAAASVGVLYLVPAERALDLVCGLGAVAGALAVGGSGRSPRRRPLLVLCGVVLVLAGIGVTGALRISPFKPLPQALRVTGAELVETRYGPLGMVSAVENREVPFRSAPGLSLLARAPVTEQVALFVDADGPLAVVRHDASSPPPVYLEDLTSALPYRLVERPRVLVLGAGGGAAVLQALGAGARSVDAVELQPHVVDMVRGRYRGFSGGVYEHPAVAVHVADPRGYVEASGDEYDLVQIIALGASTAGLHALEAQRLLTVESVRAVLARLSAAGVAAFTVRTRLPPRDGVRLLATVLDAMKAAGIRPAGEHFAWIRSWSTSTLVVSRSPLSVAQFEVVREFARLRAFDLIHLPDIRPGEANRFNILDRPYFHEATQRLLGGRREAFVRDYKFDIRPATDDRPYFSSFFRWSHAPEVLGLSRRGGIGLLDIGYLALPAALVQAVAASVALILLPLLALRRERSGARYGPTLGGFFCIGLAFLLIEIAFIGRFTIILSHPVHALVVVLAAFLLFAGAGSYLSARRGAGTSITGPVHRHRGHRRDLCARFTLADCRSDRRPPGREDRGCIRAHFSARHADGHAVSPSAGAAERRRPVAAPLGLGHQRVRIGHRGGACDPARHPLRPYGGDPRGCGSLPGGRCRRQPDGAGTPVGGVALCTVPGTILCRWAGRASAVPADGCFTCPFASRHVSHRQSTAHHRTDRGLPGVRRRSSRGWLEGSPNAVLRATERRFPSVFAWSPAVSHRGVGP